MSTRSTPIDELIRAYDETGTLCMILQEFIEFDQFVRCICVGQTNIMPIKYDPKNRRYIIEHEHLSPGTRRPHRAAMRGRSTRSWAMT